MYLYRSTFPIITLYILHRNFSYLSKLDWILCKVSENVIFTASVVLLYRSGTTHPISRFALFQRKPLQTFVAKWIEFWGDWLMVASRREKISSLQLWFDLFVPPQPLFCNSSCKLVVLVLFVLCTTKRNVSQKVQEMVFLVSSNFVRKTLPKIPNKMQARRKQCRADSFKIPFSVNFLLRIESVRNTHTHSHIRKLPNGIYSENRLFHIRISIHGQMWEIMSFDVNMFCYRCAMLHATLGPCRFPVFNFV